MQQSGLYRSTWSYGGSTGLDSGIWLPPCRRVQSVHLPLLEATGLASILNVTEPSERDASLSTVGDSQISPRLLPAPFVVQVQSCRQGGRSWSPRLPRSIPHIARNSVTKRLDSAEWRRTGRARRPEPAAPRMSALTRPFCRRRDVGWKLARGATARQPSRANTRERQNRHQTECRWIQPGATRSVAVAVSHGLNGNAGETLSSFRVRHRTPDDG